jgi:hypothetical protein
MGGDRSITVFSPKSQVRGALILIRNANAAQDLLSGLSDKLKTQWVSLPGGSDSHKLTVDKLSEFFKKAISNELNGKSNIALPVGDVSKYINKPE